MPSAGRLYVTVSAAFPLLPAASCAVTVIKFVPPCKATPVMFHAVVPLAVPPPPPLLLQVTCVTPTLSLAVPLRLMLFEKMLKVEALVGDVMLIVGGVVSGGL